MQIVNIQYGFEVHNFYTKFYNHYTSILIINVIVLMNKPDCAYIMWDVCKTIRGRRTFISYLLF